MAKYIRVVTLLLTVVAAVILIKREFPAPVKQDEKDVSIVSGVWSCFRGNSRLNGVSAASLKKKFRMRWNVQIGNGTKSSPIVSGGKVYVGTGDGELHALYLQTGQAVWSQKLGSSIEAPPFSLDGRIYIGDTDGVFHALDATTGKEIWRYKAGAQITGSANSTVLPDGRKIIFVGSHDSCVYAFNVSDGSLIWKYKTENYVNGSPAVWKSTILVAGCDNYLRGLDSTEGKQQFAIDIGSYIPGSAAVVEDMAFVGHYGNQVVALDLLGHKIAWTFGKGKQGSPFFSSPAADKHAVYIGSRDKNIYKLNAKDGRPVWVCPTAGDVDGSAVLCNNLLVIGGMDGRLYVLDSENGQIVYQYDTGSAISCSPAMVNNAIVICTEDGTVTLFESFE